MTEEQRLLQGAVHEIRQLREQNKILGAQVHVLDIVAELLYRSPRSQGMAEDIAWAIQRYLDQKAKPHE